MLGLSLIYSHTLLIMLNLFVYYSDGMWLRSVSFHIQNQFYTVQIRDFSAGMKIAGCIFIMKKD